MTFNWSTDPNRLIPFDTARAEDVNAGFDGVTTALADITATNNASVRAPSTETLNELSAAAVRKGKVLTFNGTTGQPETVINSVDVTTIAGIAGDVTTVSGISANVTTVAGISGNVTSVATNSANINAVAGNASNINSVVANATNINSCATNMASILDAPTQASNAAASAASAAATYDSFDDRYLGSKASAPTLDNDGNALLTGAIYWDTTSNQLFVYGGTSWKPAYFSDVTAIAMALALG